MKLVIMCVAHTHIYNRETSLMGIEGGGGIERISNDRNGRVTS